MLAAGSTAAALAATAASAETATEAAASNVRVRGKGRPGERLELGLLGVGKKIAEGSVHHVPVLLHERAGLGTVDCTALNLLLNIRLIGLLLLPEFLDLRDLRIGEAQLGRDFLIEDRAVAVELDVDSKDSGLLVRSQNAINLRVGILVCLLAISAHLSAVGFRHALEVHPLHPSLGGRSGISKNLGDLGFLIIGKV